MYRSFFGLKMKPFELLPNPDFLFLSTSHKKALYYLDHALLEQAGFMLLTGEIGSGKTTVIRDLLRRNGNRLVFAKVTNTNIGPQQLLSMVIDDFGISAPDREKSSLLKKLNEFLIAQYARGTTQVLVIDEAQNLSPETLEEVRMLSNLETDSSKLLQIILVGQPELRQTLNSANLQQLRQRISFACHLSPLSCEEVKEYILHRLEVAGNRDAVEFESAALELVYCYSRGIPRLINIMCDFLMLSAFAEETRIITAALVRDIAGEMEFERHYWGRVDVCENGPLFPRGTPDSQSVLIELREKVGELLSRLETLESQKSIFPGIFPSVDQSDSCCDVGRKSGFLGKLFRA